MWEVRDAEEGEVHPSVRERERGESVTNTQRTLPTICRV